MLNFVKLAKMSKSKTFIGHFCVWEYFIEYSSQICFSNFRLAKLTKTVNAFTFSHISWNTSRFTNSNYRTFWLLKKNIGLFVSGSQGLYQLSKVYELVLVWFKVFKTSRLQVA